MGRLILLLCVMGLGSYGGAEASAALAEAVSAYDDGGRVALSTYECPGHQILTRNISLQNAHYKYSFKYSGCQDPSHQGEHPSSEGNFGMPAPSSCNWYHSGFLNIDINGKDVVRQDLQEMRVLESGARGGFQVVWAHPQAEVGLRVMLLPGANHVLCQLKWQPRPGAEIKNVRLGLRCYPSFFTAARQRRGERHVKTPRTDQQEPSTLQLAPGEDIWLLYYDAIFDVAKGEGEGPCAALLEQTPLLSGRVAIGDYAVMTYLDLKPEAGAFRFALYDFAGRTNAEAEAYLQAHGQEDWARLLALDFRPQPVRELQLPNLKAEVAQLLEEAKEDGSALKPKIEALLQQMEALSQKAQHEDWQAEADLAELWRNSQDLLWRLRIFALLNRS